MTQQTASAAQILDQLRESQLEALRNLPEPNPIEVLDDYWHYLSPLDQFTVCEFLYHEARNWRQDPKIRQRMTEICEICCEIGRRDAKDYL